MSWRWTDRVALGCFVAALVGLVGFHFLVIDRNCYTGDWVEMRGWEIWQVWWSGLKNPKDIEWTGMMPVVWAAIHLWVLSVLASPFLIRWLAGSRLLWWLVCVCSAVVMIVLGGYLTYYQWVEFDPTYEQTTPGLWCLAGTPVLHFLGVMFVRKRREV